MNEELDATMKPEPLVERCADCGGNVDAVGRALSGGIFCGDHALKDYMPQRFQGASIRNFSEAFQPMLKNCAEQGGLIWGEPGVGKTHALWAAARYRAETPDQDGRYRRFPVVHTWSRLAIRQRGCFQAGATESEADIVKDVCRQRLVFIDDVCDEKVELTNSAMGFFVEIFDRLYADGKGVLITTNLDPSPNGSLRAKLSKKVVERIIHGRPVIELTGKNRREECQS